MEMCRDPFVGSGVNERMKKVYVDFYST